MFFCHFNAYSGYCFYSSPFFLVHSKRFCLHVLIALQQEHRKKGKCVPRFRAGGFLLYCGQDKVDGVLKDSNHQAPGLYWGFLCHYQAVACDRREDNITPSVSTDGVFRYI